MADLTVQAHARLAAALAGRPLVTVERFTTALRTCYTGPAADETLRAKLDALRVSLKSAGQTAGAIIAQSAGLSFGFNAMDGD